MTGLYKFTQVDRLKTVDNKNRWNGYKNIVFVLLTHGLIRGLIRKGKELQPF